jgi:hypothetical protein
MIIYYERYKFNHIKQKNEEGEPLKKLDLTEEES